MNERRHGPRRGEDLETDPAHIVQRVQFQVERRHVENTQRFDRLEENVRDLSAKLDVHISEEVTTRMMLTSLHECVDRNAETIERKVGEVHENIDRKMDEVHKIIADMKDNFLPLLIKDAAFKTWTGAQVLRKTAQWLAPVITTSILVTALIMWALGLAPFPH